MPDELSEVQEETNMLAHIRLLDVGWDDRQLILSYEVHFAVDEQEVRFCTHLNGKASWFLPFNLGWNDGAGNPPNPNGLKTDYLWKRILTRPGLTALRTTPKSSRPRTRRPETRAVQIGPRFHHLDVVRRLLADAQANGAAGAT